MKHTEHTQNGGNRFHTPEECWQIDNENHIQKERTHLLLWHLSTEIKFCELKETLEFMTDIYLQNIPGGGQGSKLTSDAIELKNRVGHMLHFFQVLYQKETIAQKPDDLRVE